MIFRLLTGSILLNLLFILAGIFIFQKRGGWSYFSQKILSLVSGKPDLAAMQTNPYYCYKVDYFSGLMSNSASIVFLGDSLTEYWELSEAFPDYTILNRGIAGDRTDGLINRLYQIIALKPSKLFIEIGINDLIQGRSVSQTITNYQVILERLNAQLPETEIFVQSVLPVNNILFQLKQNRTLDQKKISKFNTQLKSLVERFSLVYIDLWSHFVDSNQELESIYSFDGVHLTGEGYLKWQKLLESYL